MWLLYFFMRRSIAAALIDHTAPQSKSPKHRNESAVTSCCEAGSYLLVTYTMDDVIADANVNMMHFTQLSNK